MTISQPLRTDARSPEPPPPGETGARRGRRTVVLAILAAVIAAVLLAVLVVPTLLDKQPRRSGTNSAFPTGVIAKIAPNQTLCQAAIVPQDTRAIEIPLQNGVRAAGVQLALHDGVTKRVLARVDAGPVRARATRFTLPTTLKQDVLGTICLHQSPGHTAQVLGAGDKRGLLLDGKATPGAITVAYYRAGRERLISLLPEIARRIGRTRGHLGGAWRGIAVLGLFGIAVGLSAWLLVGLARDRDRARRAVLVVALVTGANALAWGLLTPTFQTPDEPYHVSYVQDLAEHGKPPRAARDSMSSELYAIQGGAALGDINFNPFGRGYWSADADRRLAQVLAKKPSTDNKGANANVRDYPPGYYAALVPAYAVAHAAGGSTLDALTFMRALGALLAAVTAVAVLLMLRELFPERPLLAGGVALICSFQPVFTWISGGVNPDAALIPTGAVLFWLLARAHRRGLTTPVAAGIGLCVALAGVVKLSGLGLAPGAALGVALLLWHNPSGRRLRPALAAAGGVAIPAALYAFVTVVVWGYPLVPGAVGAVARAPSPSSVKGTSGFATYLWEYVLPRFGSMTDFFHVGWTPKDFWTPLFVGKFGWFDYGFSSTINNVAFVLYAVIAIAALVALIPRLRRDWLLVVVYLALAAGLAVAIARVGYPLRASGNFLFEQARYVLPLIGLYALALALAFSWLRGRALVAVTSIAVGLASMHLLAAFVLTIRRYYL